MKKDGTQMDESLAACLMEIKQRAASQVTEKGMTMAELARASGLSESSVFRFLNFSNLQDICLSTVFAMGKALGVQGLWLLGATDEQ